MDNTLETVRKLSKESRAGLLLCYNALKTFDSDYRRALAWLTSDSFKREIRK